jgi:hypothetical protein
MRLRLLTILATLAMVLTFVPVVSAASQGSCLQADTSQVFLYENIDSDGSDGDDQLIWCSDLVNLASVNHTLLGNCNNGNFGSTTWNDCVSSFRVRLPAHSRWCAYWNSSYAGAVIAQIVNPNSVSAWSNTINFAVLNRDALSSFRWTGEGGPC